MIGTAGVKGLKIDCIVGILDHERLNPQTVIVDIELDYDLAAAAGSEAIGDAVDYAAAAQRVTELVRRRAFQLIETMAEDTATMLLAQFPSVVAVRLEIRKPAALPTADCSFVRMERTRR